MFGRLAWALGLDAYLHFSLHTDKVQAHERSLELLEIHSIAVVGVKVFEDLVDLELLHLLFSEARHDLDLALQLLLELVNLRFRYFWHCERSSAGARVGKQINTTKEPNEG